MGTKTMQDTLLRIMGSGAIYTKDILFPCGDRT